MFYALLVTARRAFPEEESLGTGDDDQPRDDPRYVRAESGTGDVLERLGQRHQPQTPDDERRYDGEYRQGDAARDTRGSELDEAAGHSSPRCRGRL